MIEPALVAGFASVGMDVRTFGPLPTPGVAMMTRSAPADLGVMISASHNPFHDNGIKLFGPDGFKLSDGVEQEIEARLANGADRELAQPWELGKVKWLTDVQGRYTEFVKHTFPKGVVLQGLRIVVDCANGACYKVAPEVLYELGADVISIGVEPDGFNINRRCGSTSPDALCQSVTEYRADFGMALYGDGDRVVLVDETGALVDGDQVMGLIANHWKKSGQLRGGGLVATVMSNMGLERYLQDIGLSLERTRVGDRYVVETMRERGYNVGGEQSGHIILSDYSTTGDGLVAALQVLAVVLKMGRPVSEVCHRFEPLPQILKNVRYRSGKPLEEEQVVTAIEKAKVKLGAGGRLIIRPSGTEPVIRVMGEGDDHDLVNEVVDDVVNIITKAAA